MSKSAKQIIFILIFLFFISCAFVGLFYVEKQKVENEKNQIQKQLKESEKVKLEVTGQLSQLNDQVSEYKSSNENLKKEKTKIQRDSDQKELEIVDLKKKLSAAEEDRDKWKSRMDNIKQERDDLISKLKEAQDAKPEPQIVYQEKIVYKEKEPAVVQKQPDVYDEEQPYVDTLDSQVEESKPISDYKENKDVEPPENDQYWASILRQKAQLEIELNNVKKELSDSSIQIVELKQDNSNLKIEIENLSKDKEEVEREIKNTTEELQRKIQYIKEEERRSRESKEALINNLSLELARSKNDKKFVSDRFDSLNEENKTLRTKLKQLVTTKSALEKTIIRLKQEKETVKRELEERENIIQSKINEIWEVKASLDQAFSTVDEVKQSQPKTSGVELSPIKVKADSQFESVFDSGIAKTGYDGKVVSINLDNNFAIVDIGEKKGMHIGDTLSVYRNDEHIASLEVIQVRPDISAADIKEQWAEIKTGDIVR